MKQTFWLKDILLALWNFIKDVATMKQVAPVDQFPEPLPAPKTTLMPDVPAPTYQWDTTLEIIHSMRLIGDEMGLTWTEKDLLCAICRCESGYNIHARLENSPTSIDRGLFQWNNHYHPEITDDIAYDPEKTTRLACKAILAGKATVYWSASKHCWNKTGEFNSVL